MNMIYFSKRIIIFKIINKNYENNSYKLCGIG